jgi:hypothetical protein
MTNWNEPDSQNALTPWLLIDQLTLFQAVMLIFGRDPSHDMAARPKGYVPIAMAMKRAIERSELPAQRKIDPLDGGFYSLAYEDTFTVNQADVRAWLERIGKKDAFFFLADATEWPNAPVRGHAADDQPLTSRERSNLLRIIRALSIMAKLPERGAALAVEKQLEDLHFTSPREGTIRNALNEARDMEP